MQATTTSPANARDVDLILSHIDTLPALPAIATRLLALTTSDKSETRDVIELIKADQSLSEQVLSLCRQAYLGMDDDTLRHAMNPFFNGQANGLANGNGAVTAAVMVSRSWRNYPTDQFPSQRNHRDLIHLARFPAVNCRYMVPRPRMDPALVRRAVGRRKISVIS